MKHERQDGDMSITCSTNVAQTENKVLEAGSPRDKRCMSHLCHFSQLRSKNHLMFSMNFSISEYNRDEFDVSRENS